MNFENKTLKHINVSQEVIKAKKSYYNRTLAMYKNNLKNNVVDNQRNT